MHDLTKQNWMAEKAWHKNLSKHCQPLSTTFMNSEYYYSSLNKIFHSIFRDGYKFDGTIPVHYWGLGTPRTHRKESSNNLYICHLYQTKYLLLTHNSKCMYHLAIKQGQRTFFVGFYKSMHVKRSKWIKLSYEIWCGTSGGLLTVVWEQIIWAGVSMVSTAPGPDSPTGIPVSVILMCFYICKVTINNAT